MTLLEDLRKAHGVKRRSSQVVLNLKDEIQEALKMGYNRKAIWELLVEEKKIDVKYSAFLKALQKILSEDKEKNKSIYNSLKEKKGFVHNPVSKKDLI